MLAVSFSLCCSLSFGRGGCQSTTLTAQITPTDTAFACIGAPVDLAGDATGGQVLAWEWSTGETDQNISVFSAGTYWLVVFDASGCTDTAFVEVVFRPKPTVDLGADRTVCFGDTVVLNGGPFVKWTWSTGDTTSSVTIDQAMTVALIVENSFTCKDSDTVSIFNYPVPVVDIGNDTLICAGETIMLDAGAGYTSYLWSTGETASFILAGGTGQFAVVVTDTFGCMTPSNTVNLVVDTVPVPTITEANNELTSSSSNSYQWFESGQSILNATMEVYAPDSDGTFTVEVTNANGCTATSAPYNFILFQEITSELISQGFSPNNDGVLDTWKIPYLEFYPDNELILFNRWGNTVFTQKPFTTAEGWDGKNLDGKDLTDGVYFYILDLGGEYGKIQGQVVINR